MLPLAALLSTTFLLQTPAVEAESAAPNVPYPIQETVEPAEGDAKALLGKVVDGMGRKELETLERIGFTSEFWNWRGPKLAYYEKFHTKATLGAPIGLVREATISPETGNAQGVRRVVNEDDRFYVQRTTVSSSAQAERMATHAYYNQLFLVLAPWMIERSGAEVTYEGIATLSTFEPRKYAAPDGDGSGGFSDYKPKELRCHKLRAALPAAFEGANGAEAELWISTEDVPRLVAVRSLVESRAFAYARTSPIYHYVTWQEVGGMTLPSAIDGTPANDAERQERIVIGEIEPNVAIADAELRRP